MRRVAVSSPWVRVSVILTALVIACVFALSQSATFASGASGQAQVRRPAQAAPGQRAVQVPRQPAEQIASTRVEVQLSGGDTEKWAYTHEISVAYPVPFRWKTTKTGIAKARWIVTNSPMTSAQSTPNVLLDAWLAAVPAPNTYGPFTVDFRKFAPAKPPGEANPIVYYVQVVLYDAQDTPVGVSTSVRVKYFVSSSTTTFGDDMSNPGDTRAQAILTQVYNIVKGRFGLQAALGPATWSGTVPAMQSFNSPNGVVSMEVTKNPERVLVAVPRINEQNQIAAYQWFTYQYYPNSVDGWMVGPERDQDPPPDALPPILADTGAWANYRFYLGGTWGASVRPAPLVDHPHPGRLLGHLQHPPPHAVRRRAASGSRTRSTASGTT